MLSKYCSNVANKYGIKIGRVNKFVLNLGNKIKYVLHYRNLQLYLSLGMKLTKVHRILKFKQSDWLKKNTLILIQTKELMNNSIFGKTMENLRKMINVSLVNNAGDYKKYVSKTSFVSQKIFSKNFVAIHEIKLVLTINETIFVRFSILDLIFNV